MRTLTLERILGRGAMGTTYAATIAEADGGTSSCAVKVMKGAGGDRQGLRERLAAQGRVLAEASVSGVLGVEEVLEVEGWDAVATTLVEGIDLGAIVSGGALPAKACAEVGAALAGHLAMLHAVHPEPLAHQDLKPSNVIITAVGDVWLLDFGVARAAYAEREDKTQGLVLGTLNYFPPEILSGGTPDRRVDVYGLGVLLLELSSGQAWGPPLMHRERFMRRVDQRLAALPDERAPLADVLGGLLCWERGERRTAAVAAQDFAAAAASLPGPGLVDWAATAIEPMMAMRRVLRSDDLVGRTFDLKGERGPEQDQRSDRSEGLTSDRSNLRRVFPVLAVCAVLLVLGLAGVTVLSAGVLALGWYVFGL